MEACGESKGISTIRNSSSGGGVDDGWGGHGGLQPNILGNLYKEERGLGAGGCKTWQPSDSNLQISGLIHTPERLRVIAQVRYGFRLHLFSQIPFDFSFHKPRAYSIFHGGK